jgi:hypothetical protein
MRMLILSAALAATAAAADARVPISAKTTDRLAILAIQKFGRCAVQRSPTGAAKLLSMDFRTEEYGTAMRRFFKGHSYCIPGTEMASHGLLVAGALAESLLETSHRGDALQQRLATPPAVPLKARSETELMALCAVNKAPERVAALLKQPVASDEEVEALKILEPALTACLAKGQALRVNRPGLRSLLALAAWRIAEGAAD